MFSTSDIPTLQPKLAIAIIAGGQGKRMGGVNKGLMIWQGQPIIFHLLNWVNAELKNLHLPKLEYEVLIISNDHHPDYQAVMAQFDFPIQLVSDRFSGFLGPLAGIDAAFTNSQADWLQILPSDCPSPPPGLVKQLLDAQQADVLLTIPQDAERIQPLFSQIHRSLWPSVINALQTDKLALYRWMQQQPHQEVPLTGFAGAISNLNTLQSIEQELT